LLAACSRERNVDLATAGRSSASGRVQSIVWSGGFFGEADFVSPGEAPDQQSFDQDDSEDDKEDPRRPQPRRLHRHGGVPAEQIMQLLDESGLEIARKSATMARPSGFNTRRISRRQLARAGFGK
jgi:hypothetical protein